VAFVLLPVFLAASLLCVCSSASAAGFPAKAEHSCCPEGGHGSRHEKSSPCNHRSDCNHCGQSQIAAGEGAIVPIANALPLAWMIAVSTPVEETLLVGTAPTPVNAPAWHPPGPLFGLNCALLL
jgi:hypothetical protein